MDLSVDSDDFIPSASSIASVESPRKRKRSGSSSHLGSTSKKSRHGINDEYLELLNHDILGCTNNNIDHYGHYETSQVGSVSWSSKEKARLFLALDHRGRDDILGIARSIRTKSEVEVEAYLNLLEEQSKLQLQKEGHREQADITHLHAALEVSQELEDALDDTADKLANRQLSWEESVERQRYGQFWRIDERTYLPELIKEQEDGEAEHFPAHLDLSTIHGVSELIRVDMMMSLSRYMFMNSRDSDNNYRAYAMQDEIPSIQLTALLDLYGVIKNITKRLVTTAHFMALTRLRSGSRGPQSRVLKNYVKSKDVDAALSTLGIRKTYRRGDYWVRAVRRCNVAVHATTNRAEYKLGAEIPDDELEQYILGHRYEEYKATLEKPIEAPLDNKPDCTRRESDELTELFDEADLSDEESLDESDIGDQAGDEIATGNHYTLLDKHLEAKDKQSAATQEVLLWHMVGRDDESRVESHDLKQVKLPVDYGKARKKPSNWRTWTEYKTSWERFDRPPPESAFTAKKVIAKPQQARRLPIGPGPYPIDDRSLQHGIEARKDHLNVLLLAEGDNAIDDTSLSSNSGTDSDK